jgi:hypothetical protein
MKIFTVGAELLEADGRTDVMKLPVALFAILRMRLTRDKQFRWPCNLPFFANVHHITRPHAGMP